MKFKDMKKVKISGQVPDFGAIFMSDSSTKEECFERRLFGLPYGNADFVMKVKAGMILFLFEYTKRELYGVFEAISDGQMNIVSSAYSSYGKSFPAQVRFRTIWECHEPLSEPEFGEAIRGNYFSHYKFNFGLSRDQVCRLLMLFDSRRVRVPKLYESNLCNLSSDSNVLGIQCSSTSAANYSSSSVSGLDLPLSASGSTKAVSQKESENLETELGDFIPLSSSSDSDSGSSPGRDPWNGISELSASDDYLGVKGLYSDHPTKGSNVFSRLNIWQVQENRKEVHKPVLEVIKDLLQKPEPSEDRPEVLKKRMKADKSVLEVMEELQKKHEKWFVGRQAKSLTKENRDLTLRKRSVFLRLNVAPKHDFRGDRSNHGLSEELKSRLSSRPCPGSREELQKHGYGGRDRPFAGLRAEFQTYGSKVDRSIHGFRHRKRKVNSYKEENEVCMAERASAFSRLNWASETKLQTSDHQEVKLSESGSNQHKKRRVKPLLSNKSTVVSQQCSANKEKRGDTDISLSQKGQVSPGSNSGVLSKSATECEEELIGEIGAKTCYGDETSTMQDCNQKMPVEDGNAMCSEPSVKADGGVEYGELLSPKAVVPTDNPNETCNQKKSLEKGNTECSEACTEMDASMESGEVLPDKEGDQTQNPSIICENDEEMVGPEEGNIVSGNAEYDAGLSYKAAVQADEGDAEICMEKENAEGSNPSAETNGGLETVQVLCLQVSVQTDNPSIPCAKDDFIQNAECFDPSTKTGGSAADSETHSSPKANVQAENASCSCGNWE